MLAAVFAIRGSNGAAKEGKLVENQSQAAAKTGDRAYSKSGHDVRSLDRDRIEHLAKDLTPDERRIILEKGTERAFTGDLLEVKEDGVYTCRLCGLPLFSSNTKFKSGSGWPSFFRSIDPDHVNTVGDSSQGMVRMEITCARCGSHLGHVFDDGPKPTGQRFCVNSASLDFASSNSELPSKSRPVERETAYFAGGCFWGVEDRFQQVPGVIDAVSGYMGGDTPDPTYREVCSGSTGHAETVRVTFDPQEVSYEGLLEWFFKFHNPTQLNRQGPDRGTQYRSAIFAADERQLHEAKTFIDQLSKSHRFEDHRIVTTVEAAQAFHDAEEHHQDYHAKHGGSCALPDAP
ncbi:MAG: bifunctional methionine sulfoxide reductase B/A protein [Planctomycetes bacterium]|nr:bifunctional methionine sulfoxide reductase B/A protein [Planctomycetota bacterium]